MSDGDDYEIGYGRPPKHSRFQKGQSGNPGGRKKGSQNFNTDLDEVLGKRVTVTENGKTRKVTSRAAALQRLREKALNGHTRALEQFLALAQTRSEEKDAQSAGRNLSQSEAAILLRFEEEVLAQANAKEQPDKDEEAPENG